MKLIKRILPAVCLVLSFLMLSACGLTIHEGIGDGDAMDKSTGTVWYHASTCYEAVELEKKLGKLVVGEHDLELYKILDMDPDEWVATEDKNVLYTSDIKLPTLADLKPTELYFYIDGSAEHKLHTISDSDTLQSIIKAYSENTSTTYDAARPAYKTYRVKFNSSVYKGLYYALTYVEYSTDYVVDDVNYGKYFLYDRFDQKFIPVGDEIHKALKIE